ncbi:MAG TPA: magnesium-translocating P-type ATPase [Candidatus Acidoferrum sp.]|nr:magnesium-translocating P-type ATPase [Candidatus Acidoferrum sp.]
MAENQKILSMSADDVLTQLKTSQSGLSAQEVQRRLATYGPNELADKQKRTGFVEILYHLRNPLVLILLIAGLVSGFVGETTDAVIIFFIVLLSISLDVYQESKAQNAAEALKERVTTKATVLRDGVKQDVKISEVVPGDIAFLKAGDLVPADGRLIASKDLNVNQSALTGEAFPVEKNSTALVTSTIEMTGWNDYVFLGTSVVSGTGTVAVVNTGKLTEYGKIAKALVAKAPETEFEKGLRRFGALMTEVTLFLVIFVFFVNAFFYSGSRSILDSLLFAVALAVGLTPELLPMIMSINLSRGAVAMSKKGVIVKRLASIQNFGNMDILCTDKTGTLTENKLTLNEYEDIEGKEDQKVLTYGYFNCVFETGLKSPLDDAVLQYKQFDVTGINKVDEIPFDFIRRRVSVVIELKGQRLVISKGAPEEILKICTFCETNEILTDFTSVYQGKFLKQYNELSAQGYRVLAVAYKKVQDNKTHYSIGDESQMVFLGFLSFFDPPKESAKESINLLARDGVELKIVTGDNELVTRTVCTQLGFSIKGIVTGYDIAQLQDDALARVVEENNIFARVNPAQKDRVITALRANGHVVGYMGDGINDAPSLKTADVGISVENAVDVAKESADLILLKPDLTVLDEGVLEGRKTFGNTMKYIMMGVSSNFGTMFSVAGASLFLSFLPMTAIQILLNNLLYDLSEATIPTDNVDDEYIQKPKKLDISYIRRFMVTMGPVSSIFDYLTFFLLLFVFLPSVIGLQQQHVFQTAWFIESIITQTLVVFVLRTRKTPFWKSKPGKYLVTSCLTVIAVALALPYTPLGAIFSFTPPPATFYLALAGLITAYLLLVEVVKKWFLKRYSYRLEQIYSSRKRN